MPVDGLAGGFQLIAFNRQRVIPDLEVRQLGGDGFPVLHKRFLLTKNFVLFGASQSTVTANGSRG